MNTTQFLNDIEQLPPEAQRLVEDFIAFIKMRHQEKTKRLSEEEFVGKWSNRPEMQDSTQWVKNTRQGEWSKDDV